MNRTYRSLICAAVVLSPLHLGAQTAEIKCAVRQVVRLPGIPLALSISVTNHGDTPLAVANGITVKYARDGARPVDVKSTVLPGDLSPLAPGGSRELYIPSSVPFLREGALGDAPLLEPGSYHVSLWVAADPGCTVDYVVPTPTADDAVVWSHIQTLGEKTGGFGAREWSISGAEVFNFIISSHLKTAYLTYAAMRGPKIALADSADFYLSQAGSDLKPELELAIAESFLAKAHVAELDCNYDEAAGWGERAMSYLRVIDQDRTLPSVFQTTSKDLERLVHSKKEYLDDFYSMDQYREATPLRLQSRVECVTLAGESLHAWFSYTNPNGAEKYLLEGPANNVTPSRLSVQPKVFIPGDHRRVFDVEVNGPEIKWHLDGTSATANRQSTHCE